MSATPITPDITDFQILRMLGRGGVGVVYEAYQVSMRRKVALKIIEADAELSSSGTTRFEREAWIAGRLNHSNIVRVYGQGAEGTPRYISMELVDGQSLHQTIADAKQVGAAKQRHYKRLKFQRTSERSSHYSRVADALQCVHQRGVVHRDIKPMNLLLTKDHSRLLITDFGLARDQESSLTLTRRGDFLGTLRYMSPEQLLAYRTNVDHRTDVWSFGVWEPARHGLATMSTRILRRGSAKSLLGAMCCFD